MSTDLEARTRIPNVAQQRFLIFFSHVTHHLLDFRLKHIHGHKRYVSNSKPRQMFSCYVHSSPKLHQPTLFTKQEYFYM